MKINSQTINIATQGFCDIINLTPEVLQYVSKTGVKEGQVTVFTPGSTAGVTTVEYEDGLIQDLKEKFAELVPEGKTYHHDARWGDGNGFSHVRASLLGPSLTVPISKGEPTLGTWQQIVLIDFDNRARERKVILQVVGSNE